MKLLSHFKTAGINLLSSKLRTLLTMLGIIVGTGSVVALLSSGYLATQEALAQFDSLGLDLMAVSFRPKDPSNTHLPEVTVAKLNDLKHRVRSIKTLAPYMIGSAAGSFEDIPFNTTLIGVTQELSPILHLKIQQGRFISNLDGLEHFCLLGNDLFKQLQTLAPIGKKIRLNNLIFTIIGVMGPFEDNIFFHMSINNSIIVPIQSLRLLSSYSKINDSILRIKAKTNLDTIKNQINSYFEEELPGYMLNYQSSQEVAKGMAAQQDIFALLLGFIGSIALFVSGIGVMNIMLASISERKYEVGLRIALGAKPSDIQWMFLCEAITLAIAGGILGIFLGLLSTYLIAQISGWGFKVLLFPPFIGFSASILVSVAFGLYPAYLASKLNPIDALRGT